MQLFIYMPLVSMCDLPTINNTLWPRMDHACAW